MVKKFLLFIIFLFIQIRLLPQPISALTSCKELGISWLPEIFSEGQSSYILKFTISDANTLNTLKTKPYVRLLADYFEFGFRSGGMYTNPPVKIEGAEFSLDLTGDLTTANVHTGVLQGSSSENGAFDDFCSEISYQVGTLGRCNISEQTIPPKIPPNSSLTIQFVGKPDKDYQLRIADEIISSIKTDNQGQGKFSSVTVLGSNGDTKRIVILPLPIGQGGASSCYRDTTIDATAPIPAPAPSGPVLPVPAPRSDICKTDPAKCTSGGGKGIEGCTDNTENPGIATAIGCIHTNPAEFVKDLLKFVLGIGGGLAFLMMLLGAFQMLTSAGNPDTLNAGRDRLTSAVIGLLFVIFSVLLLQIIGVGILDIPGFKP